LCSYQLTKEPYSKVLPWTLEQWRCVLWSDELRFSVWQSDGWVWVWWWPGV